MSEVRLKVLVDEQFKIGNTLFTMGQIKNPENFVLEIRGGALIKKFEIGVRPFEILPGVRVSAGREDRRSNGEVRAHRVQVVIEAPPSIRIQRLRDDEGRFAS